jgi:AraC family transcriptional regulator, regulatory protein of adaptative response / methylated-DNA-[protein]-cysteine methyltransferase
MKAMPVPDYHDVALVIDILDEWKLRGGALEDASLAQKLAARLGRSRDDLQALFARWAGCDLNRFVNALDLRYARKQLQETRSMPGRYCQPEMAPTAGIELAVGGRRVSVLPVDQGKVRGKGAKSRGLTLRYGIYATPFGGCFLAMAGRAICFLSFIDQGEWQSHRNELARSWSQATIVADDGESGRQMVAQIFTQSGEADYHPPLHLLLQGTSFQIQVWQALLAIPRGALVSYQDLAVRIGRPAACRAVASAVAANPVAYLIPCHRVISKSGEIHQYRWGRSRKKAMVSWEACQ